MSTAKLENLYKIISRLSENLTVLDQTKDNLEQYWDSIAWDISKAANEIRDTKDLPNVDYSVLHVLRAIIYDTDQSLCAMKVTSPKNISPAIEKAISRIQSFQKEFDLLRGKLREIVRTDSSEHKKTGQSKKRGKRKKTPMQIYKEARERQAVQELVQDPNITAEELGKILECHKSTIVRMKAWLNKGVNNGKLPDGIVIRRENNFTARGYSNDFDGIVQPEEPED